MSSVPDWSGPSGRAVKALELSEAALTGRCGCPKRTVVIACMLFHAREGGCQERRAGKSCDCTRIYPPCACFQKPAQLHDTLGITWDDWLELLEAFDPDAYAEPKAPPQPASITSKEAELAIFDERHGPDEAPRFRLRHAGDLRAEDDLTEATGLATQGESGRRAGLAIEPTLTDDEVRDFATLTEAVEKAALLWPWPARIAGHVLPAAGRALAEIGRRRLFREEAHSLAAWCRQRYEWLPRDVDFLLERADFVIPEAQPATLAFPGARPATKKRRAA